MIKAFDPELFSAMEGERERQENHIELIASENYVSKNVMEAMGSVLTNKYAEGYPSKRYYGGCEWVDQAEELAISRLKKIFGADHANVQSHSGSSANFAAYLAFLKPGDTVLGMELTQGGHLTHGSPVNLSGKYFNFKHYGLDEKTQRIDYDKLRDLALKEKPKLIVAGASAYPRAIDFKIFAEISKEVGAVFMVDMAHIAGLVAAGCHESPVPYADVITSTTHKTMRGPRGAFVLCKEEHKKKIDSAVFPGSQGGPLMHIIAAKAVAFKEALEPEFTTYQEQVIRNAKAMENVFAKHDVPMISGGTDNHLILVDVTKFGLTGKEAEVLLGTVNITCNKNTIPNDPNGVFKTSGIRVGSPAISTRGMQEKESAQIAEWIISVLSEKKEKPEIKEQVIRLCEEFPVYR